MKWVRPRNHKDHYKKLIACEIYLSPQKNLRLETYLIFTLHKTQHNESWKIKMNKKMLLNKQW